MIPYTSSRQFLFIAKWMPMEITFVRIFLAYFETHIDYNARIALAVTFKICSKISASTTLKI